MIKWWEGGYRVAFDAEFKEDDHPRGQPGNAGEFGPGGGGSPAPKKVSAAEQKKQDAARRAAEHEARPDTRRLPEYMLDTSGPLKEDGEISGLRREPPSNEQRNADKKLIDSWAKQASGPLRESDEFVEVLNRKSKYTGLIYRGMRLDQSAIDGLAVGNMYTMNLNSSGTTKPGTAASYADAPYGNVARSKKNLTGDIPVVFAVDGDGAFIGNANYEVVLTKGSRYEVTKHERVSQTRRNLVRGSGKNPDDWEEDTPVDCVVIHMKKSDG